MVDYIDEHEELELQVQNQDKEDFLHYVSLQEPDSWVDSDIISAEEGTRMPGQYTISQSEVDVPDELWGSAISLSQAKPFE